MPFSPTPRAKMATVRRRPASWALFLRAERLGLLSQREPVVVGFLERRPAPHRAASLSGIERGHATRLDQRLRSLPPDLTTSTPPSASPPNSLRPTFSTGIPIICASLTAGSASSSCTTARYASAWPTGGKIALVLPVAGSVAFESTGAAPGFVLGRSHTF